MSLHTFSAHIGSPFRYLGKSSATRGSIIKADFRTQKNHAPICQESRFTNLALRKCESELHPADEWVESLKYKRAKDVNLTCNRSLLPYNMANAYKIGDRVIIQRGNNLNGKYYYGDIAANKRLSDESVSMSSPTVFEIISIRETDYRRTSSSPPGPTEQDYAYRVVVRSTRPRITYERRPNSRSIPQKIPHTKLREVERSAARQTDLYNENDVVSLITPFEYPSTHTGTLTNIVLGSGTLLQIQPPGGTTLRGGPAPKREPSKAFYNATHVDKREHYDVYWKSSAYVAHNEILGAAS